MSHKSDLIKSIQNSNKHLKYKKNDNIIDNKINNTFIDLNTSICKAFDFVIQKLTDLETKIDEIENKSNNDRKKLESEIDILKSRIIDLEDQNVYCL